MGRWDRVVNGLVLGFATFFVIIGVSFLVLPLTGTSIGSEELIEGGATWDKAIVGVVFLLAASPMYYYVFSKNAKSLPPAPKRPKKGESKPPATP